MMTRGASVLVRRAGLAAFLVLAGAGCSASDSDAGDAPKHSKVEVSKTSSLRVSDTAKGDRFGAYLAAHAARTRGDVRASADYYLEVYRADDTDPNIMGLALLYATADGRVDEARKLAKTLGPLKPKNMLAGYVCMVEAARNGDWQEAREAVAKLGDNGVNSLLLPLVRGWIAFGMHDVDGAIRELAPLSENRAFLPVYNFHTALIYDRAGEVAKAEEAYKKTLSGGGGRSIHAVQAAGRFFNRIGKPERTAELLRTYAMVGGDGPISQALRKQLLVDQDKAPVVGDAVNGLGEALFSVSTSLSNAQIWELSLALTQLSLRASPELDLAKVLVGDLFEGQDDYTRANAAYTDVGAKSPLSYSVRLRIAKNLERAKQPDKAAKALKALAKEYPGRPEPVVDLGNLYRSQESYDDAVEAYDEAIKRVKTIEPRHWVLFYTRGVSLERAGDWTRAENDFLHALKLQPDQPLVLNYLGYSWLDRGERMDQAQGMIEKAVEARPNDGYIVDSLGWAYYLRGKFADAVQQLEQAVVLVSDDPTINDHLGDAYWRVGRKQEARYQWQRALGLEPDSDQTKVLRDKLKNGMPPFKAR